MLAIVPLLGFIAIFLYLFGRQQDGPGGSSDWRVIFLRACLIWGTLSVVISESLSLFKALSPLWLALLWGFALAFTIFHGWLRGVFRKAWSSIRAPQWNPVSGVDLALLSGLTAIVLVLLLAAWVSVPNGTDSMEYHMARVAHWAQNRSFGHYPTSFEPQLMHPIGAELVILNFYILWGGDNPANLVQWFSMAASLIGVSALASILGADRRGQLLAVAFAASIPMGILQATSTQNDYVTAFWLVCLVYFILLGKQRTIRREEWAYMGMALGLSLLTKGTAYAYSLPFLLWFFVPGLIRSDKIQTFKAGLGVALVSIGINFGYWTRNFATYGTPLGSSQVLSQFTAGNFNLASVLSSWLRDLALNLATPSEEITGLFTQGIIAIHDFLGTDPDKFNLVWAWNHQELAGNPLHLFLIPVTLIALLFFFKGIGDKLPLRYGLIAISSFLLLSALLDFDNFGVRYQVPLFVLWAPIVGVVGWHTKRPRTMLAATILLVLASLPWVFLNSYRPIIGLRPRTMTESIFREPPVEILFANWIEMRDPTVEATDMVKSLGCKDVGLHIDSHEWEYPFWKLLGSPHGEVRMETVDTYPHLEKYLDKNFQPCLIICSMCQGSAEYLGLSWLESFGMGVELFADTEYLQGNDG